MSKHKHEPDNPQQHGRPRQAPAPGDDQDNLPNRSANTSLTNPGPPQSAVSGQFGEVDQTGQGTDLTAQMESAGPSSGNVPNSDDMIPWDPTGKIDDEVERRYRKPPASPQTPPSGSPGRGATPQTPPDVPAQPADDPGGAAPPSGTLPRDPGDSSSSDYSGPITSAPADAGQSTVRTMQDVRSAPVPAHGTRDARPPVDGGTTDDAPRKTPSKAPHPRPQRDTSGYGEVQ